MLPDNALKTLKCIFNHTMSMGYFQTKFKTAILELIPKQNADHRNSINYRPISLLEVAGKILEKNIQQKTSKNSSRPITYYRTPNTGLEATTAQTQLSPQYTKQLHTIYHAKTNAAWYCVTSLRHLIKYGTRDSSI